MLADAPAIKDAVVHGGSTVSKLSGKTVLQMGTIGPDESREVAEAVEQNGGSYIESPVLGSKKEAEAGELLLMVGCESEDALKLSPVYPVLLALGKEPMRVGEVCPTA